jgi:hypothetical protein
LSENKKQFYAARRAQAALEAMRGPIAVLEALQGFTLD